MSTLQLYNSAARAKETFTPLTPGMVRMYCCGPTVYNYAHIGNLRTYLFEDALRRTLDFLGYQVEHVVNITDVGHLTSDADTGEDKMEKGAAREGRTVWEIAAHYTREFQQDLAALRIRSPSKWVKATDHIPEQIALVRLLEKKGHAYRTADGMYFDTSTFPRYADFAGLDIEHQEAGIRVDMRDKRHSTDFALWKFSPPEGNRAMEWDSPWGRGFPGWHIECSAMAMKHLGETLDIHCGGVDHLRVHHTNEIAQSECVTGQPFARYWIHGGWLLEEEADGGAGKMSKSKGEFLRLATLVERGFDPMDYRYFCLTAHYRQYLTFSWQNLEAARESRQSLLRRAATALSRPQAPVSAEALGWLEKFTAAAADDLNLPRALGVANQMLKDGDVSPGEKGGLLARYDEVLGLGLAETTADAAAPAELAGLLEERGAARMRKDFRRSDEIRALALEKGYVIRDTPQGQVLEKKTP